MTDETVPVTIDIGLTPKDRLLVGMVQTERVLQQVPESARWPFIVECTGFINAIRACPENSEAGLRALMGELQDIHIRILNAANAARKR